MKVALKGYQNTARTCQVLAVFVLALTLVACASYQKSLGNITTLLKTGQAEAAAEGLKQRAFTKGKDQVVYLLEYGTAMQVAGNYEESNKAFLIAEQLTEVKDYHSISKITASILTAAEQVQYKGEDYEKVLINAMLAINFLMLGDLEAAMVETRKLNDKLYKYKFEAKKDYEQNPFAFYLAAMIREADRDWDGAHIDYERVYKLNPNVRFLKQDLVRAAANARRYGKVKKWKSQFGVSSDNRLKKGHGEVVLIYMQGWGPEKTPNGQWRSIPELNRRFSYTQFMNLKVGNKEVRTEPVYSVTEVAMKTLNDAYKSIIAQRVAGRVVKEVVAHQIAQKNKLLGQLTRIGLNATDRADLRQWYTVPATFQVARVQVPAGEYEVSAEGLTDLEEGSGEFMKPRQVVVKPGKKTFLAFRSLK